MWLRGNTNVGTSCLATLPQAPQCQWQIIMERNMVANTVTRPVGGFSPDDGGGDITYICDAFFGCELSEPLHMGSAYLHRHNHCSTCCNY